MEDNWCVQTLLVWGEGLNIYKPIATMVCESQSERVQKNSLAFVLIFAFLPAVSPQ